MLERTSAERPYVGDEVVTLDHASLGRVSAVFQTAFKLKSARGEQLFGLDAVYMRNFGRVTLVCNASGLPRYSLGGARVVNVPA